MNTARNKVEKYIGRSLFTEMYLSTKYLEYRWCNAPIEIVHHINGDSTDHRLENLYVFRNGGEHGNYHIRVRRWALGLGGKTQDELVEYCKTFPFLESNLDELKSLGESIITKYWSKEY